MAGRSEEGSALGGTSAAETAPRTECRVPHGEPNAGRRLRRRRTWGAPLAGESVGLGIRRRSRWRSHRTNVNAHARASRADGEASTTPLARRPNRWSPIRPTEFRCGTVRHRLGRCPPGSVAIPPISDREGDALHPPRKPLCAIRNSSVVGRGASEIAVAERAASVREAAAQRGERSRPSTATVGGSEPASVSGRRSA